MFNNECSFRDFLDGLDSDNLFINEDFKDLDRKTSDEETVIAYDSHKRLSIDSIELTPKQTSELLIFIHDLGLVN